MVFELNTGARFVEDSHMLPFLYTLRHIFIPLLWSRSRFFYRYRVLVYKFTQCGENSATLAETECSVSSVGVQSKGSFQVFLIINV